MLEELKNMRWTWHKKQDHVHASLALSMLLSDWHKPNLGNNKYTHNTLLLGFYIFVKPKLIELNALKKVPSFLHRGVQTQNAIRGDKHLHD